jgi:hypothetical protein
MLRYGMSFLHSSPPYLLSIIATMFLGEVCSALEPRITEFMADNTATISDEDGAEVDWVEIHNPNPVALDLTGWYLTDDVTVLTQWQFPSVTINANDYLIVFASGKDRRPAAGPWHTNFSLKAAGESIALVKPDGVTVVSEFTFGPQSPDISYGLASVAATTETLISATAPARALVPTSGTLGTTWTTWPASSALDAAWTSGPLAVGFEASTGYESLIGLNVLTPMSGLRTSCYIRIPFTVSDLNDMLGLTLRMRYDDGYAVYLNGTPLPTAWRNAPASPVWNSAATAGNPDAQAVLYEDINLAQHLNLLTTGGNVLAVHGMNSGATSSDFLIGPQLVLTRGTFTNGFMPSPTPGGINSSGVQGFVADTSFSVKRGFYTAPFTVAITCGTSDAVIRYTLNSDAPTASTGFVYSTPVSIGGTTVLRAVAFKAGFQPSNVDTQSYLFLDDVISQSTTGSPPAGWPAGSVNGQVFNYGMDPEVVSPRAATIKSALQAIPTLSLVTDQSNLTDPATGLYVNPGSHGETWERPASMEIINDPLNVTPGWFQENMGVRLRGGFSRDPNNPKHSFRFFFNKNYGAGKMDYRLFGTDGPATFEGFDLRTSQDASWAYLGSADNTFLRDEVSRETQVRVSYGSRCRYFHLYLNGQYWGLYNTDERPNAKYGAQYFGGHNEEYDVVKSAGASGGYATEASDGTMATGSAWANLWAGARAVRTSPTNANYFKLMGRAANGMTPTVDPVLLDAQNLADYLLILFYMGGNDGPVSDYVGASNNWFGMRRRNGASGFRFFIHDFEQSLGLEAGCNQRVGSGINVAPWSNTIAGANDINRSNPEFMHEDLAFNLEYRVNFGDRAHRLFFNGGLLTDTVVLARMNAFAAIIDTAIWGESARWGDAQRASPFLRSDWLAANERLFDFIRTGRHATATGPGRTATLITQLRGYDSGTKPLYPLVNAPVFSQHGGLVPPGNMSITMSQTNTGSTTIYYTVNGPDPRLVGGAVNSSATIYGGNVTFNNPTTTLRSRVLRGTEWSALNEAVFTRTGPIPLVITELMMEPAIPAATEITAGFTDKEDFEFIELMNVGTETLNLREVRFTNGISATLTDNLLAPGERGVIVSRQAAFVLRYGSGPRILGDFTDTLDDDGEGLTMVAANGLTLLDFSYDDDAPWPQGTAGESLVLRSPTLNPTNPAHWRRSVISGGSPSATDATTYGIG